MRNMGSGILVLLVVFGAIVLYSSAVVVDETEQVFITQFGKPVGDPIVEPGLRFKVPFLQKVRFFDKRFLEWDGHPNQVPTRDKRYISIDTFARRRIEDPMVFFQKVTDEIGAQTRLDDILDGATRNAIANHDLVEIVRSHKRTDREDTPGTLEGDIIDSLPDFTVGRANIADDILTNAAVQLKTWGIELLDIQFKRIKYEAEVQAKIFERMISERTRIAQKFRSEGEGEASKISGERERQLKTVLSEAYREAEEIKGKADAEAVAVYAAAYDRSAESREFFQFLKTLETYQSSLSSKDTLILSTRTDFYKYLRSANRSYDGRQPIHIPFHASL